MKNSPAWLNSRSEQGEENICELEDRSTEIRHYEEQKEKRIKIHEQRPVGHRQVYHHMHNGSSRWRGDRERGRKNIKEVIAENFLNLMNSVNLYIQEDQ